MIELHGNSTIGTTNGESHPRDALALNNFGTLTQTSILDPSNTPSNTPTITNEAGATWDVTSSPSGFNGVPGGFTFNNLGAFVAAGPNGSLFVSSVFNSSGTVSVQSGTLFRQGGGTDTGADSVAAGAHRWRSTRATTLTATSAVTGAGGVEFQRRALDTVAVGFHHWPHRPSAVRSISGRLDQRQRLSDVRCAGSVRAI